MTNPSSLIYRHIVVLITTKTYLTITAYKQLNKFQKAVCRNQSRVHYDNANAYETLNVAMCCDLQHSRLHTTTLCNAATRSDTVLSSQWRCFQVV